MVGFTGSSKQRTREAYCFDCVELVMKALRLFTDLRLQFEAGLLFSVVCA